MEHPREPYVFENVILDFTPSTPKVGGPDDRIAEWDFEASYAADVVRRMNALCRAGHEDWSRCMRLFGYLRFSPSLDNARARWELFEATLSGAFEDLAFAAWGDASPEDLEWRDE